jgi:hypothetical protein
MLENAVEAHLTAMMFNKKQTTIVMATQTAGLTWSVGVQYCMTVATAAYSVQTSICPPKKYVQP